MTPILHATIPTPGIIGPGRPDQPGTTGLRIDGTEPTGTVYTSTDGAGVGAWVWRKRPNGWVVIDGDTGMIDIAALANATWMGKTQQFAGDLKLARTRDLVTLRISGAFTGEKPTYGYRIPIPTGFHPDFAYIAFTSITNVLRRADFLLEPPQNWAIADLGPEMLRGTHTWHTTQPWPTSLDLPTIT